MYKQNFKKSWFDLRNNIVLVLPDLVNALFLMAFGYVILSISGLYEFFRDFPLILNSVNVEDTIFFITSNLGTIIISAVIFLVGAFFFNVSITATKFGMIRDVINKKTTSIKSGISYINKYYWRIFEVKLRVFLIYLGVLVAAILVNVILRALQLDIAALVVSALMLFILIVIIAFGLFFRYPMLFTRNVEPKRVIALSFKFFRENKMYTLVTVCMIVLVALVVSIVFDLLGLIPGIGIVIQSLDSLATMIISVWASIFTFNSFLKR